MLSLFGVAVVVYIMKILSGSSNYIFHILQFFATKLHHFTKIQNALFSAVLMNINVCLKGEWSIV